MIEIINVDIYLCSVVVLAGIDEREFDGFYYRNVTRITDEEYKEMRSDITDKNSCNGFTCETQFGDVIVFLRKGEERKELYVVHEMFHAANKILCKRGVKHDSSAEPWAYMIGYLVNEYYNRLDKYEDENKARG